MSNFKDLIFSLSQKYSVDRVLIMAICEQESNFNTWAVRYEPRWNYMLETKEYARSLHISQATETMLQSCSWGLMQIMGSVARELGFQEELPKLCNPEIGLEYGIKKLKKLLDRYGDIQDSVSAYNQGNTRKDWSGNYKNKSYVDSVMQKYARISKEINP